MNLTPLTQVKRGTVSEVLVGLADDRQEVSKNAGLALCSKAKEFGLSMRDFLTLSIDVCASVDENKNNRFVAANGTYLTGYEAALSELNLPFKNDFKSGVTLQAAADTFATRPGIRALFPETIDDMMQWSTRQDQFESTEGMVSQTRTVTGNEIITEAIFDDDGQLNTSPIAELANIPMQTIKSSDRRVKFYKHGSGIRTSYEFERRASLDVLTPYVARITRNMEIGKVLQATGLLVNGDGVHAAATVVAASAYKNWDVTGTKSLKDNYVALADFLTQRARDAVPVDTIVCNYSMFLELFLMFLPNNGNNSSDAETLQSRGMPSFAMNLDFMNGVSIRISSSAPTGQLICYSQGDTLEELVETGSVINESEQAIKNQSITYVKTINTGYRLVYGDTRTVFNTLA
jgi:hypothetical protein